MKIDYGLEMSQSQKIIVSTNLVQSLKILSKTTLELEDEIKKQAEENPIIEVEMQNSERKVDWERYINHLKHHTYNDKNESRYNADSKMDFENIISNNQNLYDYLKEQINCYKIDKTEEKVCEYIIDSLDENGYLKDEDLVIKDLNIDSKIYNRCKKYIQSLEPSGVGGSNLEESLIIQLRNLDIKDGLLEDIIKNDLNCIGNKKISLICKKYNINKSQCMNYIKLIKSLDPKPCEKFKLKDIIYIKPDVTVKKIDGEFVLEGNNTNDINIHINSFYKEILNDESSDIVAKEFIKATEHMKRSYSKKAFPWDNACIESFHSVIKREWLNRFKIRDHKQAYRLIFEYLEAFYNTKRIHSHCDYMSPDEFERVYERTHTEAELLAG